MTTNAIKGIIKEEIIKEVLNSVSGSVVEHDLPDEIAFGAHNSVKSKRIFSIMGPNGSGKTRLLEDIYKSLSGVSEKVLYIMALRSTNQSFDVSVAANPLPNQIEIEFSDVNELIDVIIDQLFSVETINLRRPGPVPARVTYNIALNTLINCVLRKDMQIKSQNDRNIIDWNTNGDRERGIHAPEKIKELWPEVQELINKILDYKFYLRDPGFHGGIMSHTKTVCYKVNEVELTTANLSLGQQQMMLMSILMLSSRDEKFTVIVDEPELHLNEQKAIEIWSSVEKSLSKTVFVYATHNVAFSTRPDVERLYFTKLDETIEEMDLAEPLPAYALKDVVGSRIQLLRTELPVIFCEDGLSKAILKDVFGDTDFFIISVAGKDSVIRASKPQAAWNDLIAGDRKCCGIIDRDARNIEQVDSLKASKVFSLPFNEIESILLHPNLILPILKSTDPDRSDIEEVYKNLVCACANAELTNSLDTLQGYIVDQKRPKINFRRGEAGITVETVSGIDFITDRFIEVSNDLLKAIEDKNIEKVLVLSCGKEVFQRMARGSSSRLGLSIDQDPAKFYNLIRDKVGLIDRIKALPGMGSLISDVRGALI